MGKLRIGVGQAGGPTAVINDTLAGIICEAQKNNGEIVGFKNGLEGGGLNPEVRGNLVDLSDVNYKELRGIPGSYLGTTRLKLKKGKNYIEIEKCNKTIESLCLDAFFYIGGNDTAETTKVLRNGIHVTKTEDNDLPMNDHTPGWGSACLSNCEIIKALSPDLSGFAPRVLKQGKEVYSTAPVVVYQTQGRDTGWLTLGTAFAKINHAGELDINAAPHLFLPRENRLVREKLLADVDRQLTKGGYCLIVCSEELVNEDGIPFSELQGKEENKDGFGHVEHGRSGSFNYAEYVASIIKNGLKVEADFDYLKIKETPLSPQHIQRSLKRSKVDAREAFFLGRAAVRFFKEGAKNESVGLKRIGEDYKIRSRLIPLEDVAGKVRTVPEKYLGNSNGPSSKFYHDFMPLINPLEMSQYRIPEFKAWKR